MIKFEIRRCCNYENNAKYLPGLQKTMDPLKQQIQADIAQKLTTTDSALKESINKMVRSKVSLYSF